MLNGEGKAGFPEETFDQRPEGGERRSHMHIWKRSLQLERTSTEALKLTHAWGVQITVHRPVWLDWREQGKAAEVEARPCRALKAAVRTLALSQ